MKQPCPARCGCQQQPGKFLCLTCWRALTDDLRALIWRTWRAFNKQRTGASVRKYREAREACLKHLNEQRRDAA